MEQQVGFLCNCLTSTSCRKNLGQFALYRGGEVGGGVVPNELLIIYVQYQAQFNISSVPSTI